MALIFSSIPTNSIVFQIEDIAIAKEGTLRLTLWRPYDGAFDANAILANGGSINSGGIATMTLKRTVIEKIPKYSTKFERYFAEPAVDAFDLTIYDTPYSSDIISTVTTGFTGYTPTLAKTEADRLFTRYIYPAKDTTLYCKIEFRQYDATSWDDCEVVTGVLQSAIEADDLFIRHSQKSQFLNYETTDDQNGTIIPGNVETDAERIWQLKFVPVTLAGLGATPAQPTTTPGDTSSWYMPLGGFWGGVKPFDSTIVGGVGTVQGAGNVTYQDSLHVTFHARWHNHINARLAFQNLFDYTYGAGQYVWESDNIPFSYRAGTLRNDFSGLTVGSPISGFNFTERADTNKWVLLPQAVFGVDFSFNGDAETPNVECGYPKKYKNAFGLITELCYSFGLIPIYDSVWSPSLNKTVPRIRFKVRDAVSNEFSTIVPVSSHVTNFPESEAGLQVNRSKSFLNAKQDRAWNDDWFSQRNGNTEGSTVTIPQRNGYVVPSIEKKPTVLDVSLNFGGIIPGSSVDSNAFVVNGHDFVPGWYSTEYDNTRYDTNNTALANNNTYVGTRVGIGGLIATRNFPCLTPLVRIAIFTDGDMISPPLPGIVFAPIVKASFDNTNSDGSVTTYTCDSLRQLLARYYARHFVRSLKTYKRTYPTIIEFADQTKIANTKVTGTFIPSNTATYGTKSWKNIQLLYKTKIFNSYYYVKSIERDFEAVETTVEYVMIDPVNKLFDHGFNDTNETTGAITGPPPTDNNPTSP